MTNQAVAVLQSALRARHLDRTLTTALPSLERTDASALAPTDIGTLDGILRGGIPRGHLSQIVGPRSSGRTTVLLRLLAAAARRGEIAALIDTFDRLDVTSTVAAQVDLTRLLWVRGQAISKTDAAIDAGWVPGEAARADEWGQAGGGGSIERAVDRALKAFDLVLQAGGFGVVALDLADVPVTALQRIPSTTWLRVQRSIEGSETACVLVAPQPLARSAGGVTLALGPSTSFVAGPSASLAGTRGVRWAGSSDRSRLFAGLEVEGRVISPRRRVEGDVQFTAVAGSR